MSSFDRSAFKPTKVKALHEQDEIASQARPGTNYATTLTLDDGLNRIRIAPAHPGTSEFIQPNNCSWLFKEVVDKDTNSKTWKKGPIFNARTHGGQSKDVVEEYINFVKKLISNATDEAEETRLKDILKKITVFNKGNDYMILPSLRWTMYCWKIKGDKKEFGELSITDGLRKKINNIATSDDDPDDVMSVDPFTDPDTGRCVLIKKEEVAKGGSKQIEYSASIDIKKETPLSEEELETLLKYEPLEKRFKNSYTRRDFELAMNGLKHLDQKLSIGVFDYDEWIDICEELHDLLPESSAEEPEKETTKPAQAQQKPKEAKAAPAPAQSKAQSASEQEDQDPEGLDFLNEMTREELLDYIESNDIAIMMKRSDTDDDIRKKLKSQLTGITNDLPFDDKGDLTGLGKARAEVSSKAQEFKNKLGKK